MALVFTWAFDRTGAKADFFQQRDPARHSLPGYDVDECNQNFSLAILFRAEGRQVGGEVTEVFLLVLR